MAVRPSTTKKISDAALDRNLRLFEDREPEFRVSSPGTMPPVSTISKESSIPGGRAVNAIASDARFIRDDGPALPDDSVEQGGFSHVRPADDGNEGQRGVHEGLRGREFGFRKLRSSTGTPFRIAESEMSLPFGR